MTNFDYLKNEKQFATFAESCIEAEKSISVSPALSALGARKSAELAVKWLYSVDDTLKMPYKDNFSALVYNPSFTDSIDDKILNCLRFIIKLENFSAHTNKQVTYEEAVLALANLFEFIQFIDYCYGEKFEEREFDESILAANKNQSVSNKELEKLNDELSKKTEVREAMTAEMANLKAQLCELRKKNEAVHEFAIFAAAAKTEEITRCTIIDVDLKEMDWTFGVDCVTEVKVVGMPTDSGEGRADYVLYGDNQKPLAVVEAKKPKPMRK